MHENPPEALKSESKNSKPLSSSRAKPLLTRGLHFFNARSSCEMFTKFNFATFFP